MMAVIIERMHDRTRNIEYSPLIDHIGKIDINENVPQRIASALYKANPHTVKIDGKYV